jgi:hypothetical protein
VPESRAAKIALTVVALIIGLTLGIWPNVNSRPAATPVKESTRPAAAADTGQANPQPPSAEATSSEAPPPIDPAATTPGPVTAQKPVEVDPPPSAPSGVTVTAVRESGPVMQVAVAWKVGSGNGRAVTGHRVTIRTNRGYVTSWQTGAGGDGGTQQVPCGSQVCDGMRVDAEVRAVSSAGESATGRGNLVYSAPYLVRRELRSDQGANSAAKAQENAQNAIPGLRATITANGVACTNWDERVISVYSTPDGSWYIFAGIVSGLCKY